MIHIESQSSVVFFFNFYCLHLQKAWSNVHYAVFMGVAQGSLHCRAAQWKERHSKSEKTKQ